LTSSAAQSDRGFGNRRRARWRIKARIRHARHELLSHGLDDPDHESMGVQKDKPAVASSKEKSGAEKFTINLSNQVRQLGRLARYERRAPLRRKFATRKFDAARVEAE
jgi:hypothetical protein